MITSDMVGEITADNYSIKLSRDKFDLSTLKQLLKELGDSEPPANSRRIEDDDLKSRRMSFENETFDRLSDK